MLSAEPGTVPALMFLNNARMKERIPVTFLPSAEFVLCAVAMPAADRKSTRLNSSHLVISYAVFCLKKKQISSTPAVSPRLKNCRRRSPMQKPALAFERSFRQILWYWLLNGNVYAIRSTMYILVDTT